MSAKNCNKCKTCQLRAATEVTGNDADIKREFERIEQAERRAPKTIAQTKTTSAVTDGV